ncbi:cytochrome P450 [Rhodopila globiformis]|uniref:Cytochrome P450 n=1 Tax=Rhodopila globiformis TaxID=1071 RepID=A0A2S6NNZ9_RHOGL|nr:cytochrome P450 [Rhodopila globiformis]PPQ39534.1 cytochrome P450 [Rhodopila globiformis]
MNAPVSLEPLGDPWATPLDRVNVSDARLFRDDIWYDWFARLRRDDPVHYTAESEFGPYWSVTRYKDIMHVETRPEVFSSASGITLLTQPDEYRTPMFIAMDPPKHDVQRNVVSPIVAPENLARMAGTIRQRAATILDGLPRNETFDWVERVSIELTTQMLATLFDYPFERRRDLTYWSNVAVTNFNDPDSLVKNDDERLDELRKMATAMMPLWNERVNAPPRPDLISMLAHGESTRHMDPMEFMGTCILLIVGGNDTTRNAISGGLWALHNFPDEYSKLRDNPGLIPGMVPEIIRWQTPIGYMRRTALSDYELGGKTIRAGDKVAMWYISGNRDPDAIPEPNRFIVDRPRPRQHLSFGFGIHRCVGNRLAELQLTILWEEILKRFPVIEVVEKPKRTYSAFVHGITAMMVRIPA